MKSLQSISFILLFQVSNVVLAVESTIAKTLDTKGSVAGSGLSDPNMAGSLIQTTLGLLVVLAVIGGAAWAFKRFSGFQAGAQGKLKVVGGISLSARERVVLLQVGNQQLVVGVAPGQIQTLHVLNEPLPDDTVEEPSSFSDKLQSALARRIVKATDSKPSSSTKLDGEF